MINLGNKPFDLDDEDNRINQTVNDNNYFLPFFWLKGEEESKVRRHMQIIRESGIRALCLESRTHPNYLEGKWWSDLRFIFDEAEKLGMKIWLFDDNHFPTGYAGGAIEKTGKKSKQFLKYKKIDVAKNQTGIIHSGHSFDSEAVVYAVVAHNHSTNEFLDITHHLSENFLHIDASDARCSIYFIYRSYNGGSPSMKWHINMVDGESTQILINNVYEVHYKHLNEYFGNVFQGFFTDEPCFGNVDGYANSPIGKDKMDIPWNDEVENSLTERLGADFKHNLPLLWKEIDGKCSVFRFAYMDVVTKLYERQFSEKIGDWCRSHHVQHIGHIVEDNGAHAELGAGAGHFFRSMKGEDMSGIDIVLGQLYPGMDDGFHDFLRSTWDESFFTYTLGKLGSSLAHVDPKKSGRALCEVFGAYGWSEGLKLMKWILDYMLCRGINYFVPHAFTMAEFPDSDCPPHFYADGNNPQFNLFRYLIAYGNRMCHLLSGGKPHPSVAVLYTAESAAPCESVTKELTRNQIDFDIPFSDIFSERE